MFREDLMRLLSSVALLALAVVHGDAAAGRRAGPAGGGRDACAGADGRALHLQRAEWREGGGRAGTFEVPENRSDPNSRKIKIGFVRFKSTSATPGDPIVYLAGGPGGTGVGTAQGPRFPLFMALREVCRRDRL